MKNSHKISFEDIIDQHKDRIYRICFSYIYNKADTEDVFQDVLFQIWKSLKQFKYESAIETWIYRIAVNRTISFNKKKNHQFVTLDDKHDIINDDQDEPEKTDQLYHAIKKLKAPERLLINMVLDSFSYNEISEILGISSNLVGVKINRIKKKLEQLMKVEL